MAARIPDAHTQGVVVSGSFDAVESGGGFQHLNPGAVAADSAAHSMAVVRDQDYCAAMVRSFPAKIVGNIGNCIVNVCAVSDGEFAYDPGYPIAIRCEVAEFQEIVVEGKQRDRILRPSNARVRILRLSEATER